MWLNPLDGSSKVWFNNYPNKPTWLEQPEIAGGVGISGSSVRWAYLQDTGRASYVAMDPDTGALSAWLNGCPDRGPPPQVNKNPCVSVRGIFRYHLFTGDTVNIEFYEDGKLVCKGRAHKFLASDETVWDVGCDDKVTSRGSLDGARGDEGWSYENSDGPVIRKLEFALDASWTIECGGRENRPIRCLRQTFHSRDKCGMELEPIDKP